MFRLLMALALVLALAPTASAGENPDIAIALHVQPVGQDCSNHNVYDCFQINTSWPGADEALDFYVFVCGHGWNPMSMGFLSARYAMLWPEDWIWVNWRCCADDCIGEILQPGDGVHQQFFECQPPEGHPVAMGILTLIPTSPGVVSIIPHCESGKAEVGHCAWQYDVVLPTPIGNGRAGFVTVAMAMDGCNPCPCVGPPCYSSLGQNPDGGIALHVQEHNPFAACHNHGVNTCFDIVTAIQGIPIEDFIDVYVFICGHGWNPESRGFRTAEYALAWTENLAFINWVSCSDYICGGPTLDGIYQLWYDCQPPAGSPVPAGILTLAVIGPGRVSMFENYRTRRAAIGDCAGGINTMLSPDPGMFYANGRAGWVDVNLEPDGGCNPCVCVGPPCWPPTPVEDERSAESTWGQVKSLFK